MVGLLAPVSLRLCHGRGRLAPLSLLTPYAHAGRGTTETELLRDVAIGAWRLGLKAYQSAHDHHVLSSRALTRMRRCSQVVLGRRRSCLERSGWGYSCHPARLLLPIAYRL